METKRALVLPDRVLYGETDRSARQNAFLREFRKRGIRADGLRLAQVPQSTLNTWLKDADFRDLYMEAKDQAAGKLQRKQWDAAVLKGDTVAQRWLLARYNPAEFGERLDINVQAGGHELRAFVPPPVEIEQLEVADATFREIHHNPEPAPQDWSGDDV